MINNPCKECIVDSMCRKECSNLWEYINYLFPYNDRTSTYLSRQIRLGIYKIIDEALWRKTSSGEQMYLVTKRKNK